MPFHVSYRHKSRKAIELLRKKSAGKLISLQMQQIATGDQYTQCIFIYTFIAVTLLIAVTYSSNFLQQGCSHQNLSGQLVVIVSQVSTYIVISKSLLLLCTTCKAYYLDGNRDCWPSRPYNCQTKVSCSYIKRAHN